MTITSTRQPDVSEASVPIELLIREARAASRRRRFRFLVMATAALAVALTVSLAGGTHGPTKASSSATKSQPASAGGARLSLYPATLKMRSGMYEGGFNVHVRSLPWGTTLPASQLRWIEIKSSKATVQWGVWRVNGDGGLFPVRSTDGGVRWTAAGAQLANAWVGGGIYFPNKVISDGPTSVVFVSNAVIDVTTDGGRAWFQYLNGASDWIISGQPVSVSVGLRIRPFPDGDLPKGSYATYVLNTARREWVRTSESVGATKET
jgi:hypothetical protein